ncbi:MAG: PhzF family phenazine biosynthesis protein [Tildeniella torsiva UHER 1998/13D]|nr:PhzF family phenazine biosynthesis protein [Tildeniella torsiva UHER 1998/13D]
MPQILSGLTYYHADVFSAQPLAGNGLTVFPTSEHLSSDTMLQLTQEMRQFESIFLMATDQSSTYHARIFTMEEELGFAGHPVLGAASVLHYLYTGNQTDADWSLILPEKEIHVKTKQQGDYYTALMNQGRPTLGRALTLAESLPFLHALNLSLENVTNNYPLQMVSTGLPYLIVPVTTGLAQARILHSNFEALLGTIDAKFVYIFDVNTNEGRTWDNAGLVEDIATGSAVGPVGAYLVEHSLAQYNETVIINQGCFVGRPSKLSVRVSNQNKPDLEVLVSGDVYIFAQGQIL